MTRILIQQKILTRIYKFFPFDIKGNLLPNNIPIKNGFISCLICASRGEKPLEYLLSDIAQQNLNKDQFEVIILNDHPNGLEDLIRRFSSLIFIKYTQNNSQTSALGDLRNKTILQATGEYLLFLDDDTRLIQKDFLQKALNIFKQFTPDMIMPYGNALSYPDDRSKRYLDSYSYATRCCFYKRSLIDRVGGFYNDLAAYEDIDLGIRINLLKSKIFQTDQITYEHPELFFKNMQKPIAIGQAIFQLQNHYSYFFWLFIYLNALRFLPLGLFPTLRNRQWFKISLGVLIAPFISKKASYRS